MIWQPSYLQKEIGVSILPSVTALITSVYIFWITLWDTNVNTVNYHINYHYITTTTSHTWEQLSARWAILREGPPEARLVPTLGQQSLCRCRPCPAPCPLRRSHSCQHGALRGPVSFRGGLPNLEGQGLAPNTKTCDFKSGIITPFWWRKHNLSIPQNLAFLCLIPIWAQDLILYRIKWKTSPARMSASSMKWVLNTTTRLAFLCLRRFQTTWRERASIPAVGSSNSSTCRQRGGGRGSLRKTKKWDLCGPRNASPFSHCIKMY